jgi:hypothetical protein
VGAALGFGVVRRLALHLGGWKECGHSGG